MARSYYEVLGIANSADEATIKAAYRRLAKKYHPDTTTDDDGEDKFKEVGEAYAVLGNAERRAYYDQFGTGMPNQNPPRHNYRTNGNTAGNIDLDELMRRFNEMNDGNPNPTYGTDGQMSIQKVPIPVEAMIHGGKVSFRYTVQSSGSNHRFLSLTQKIATTVLEPNTKVGEQIEIDGIPNMQFILTPASSQKCAVQGIDLIVSFDVNALDAAAGNKCKVNHPSGKAYEVGVPKGSQTGTALRLPKMGLTHVNGAVGSLIAVVNYVVPELSEKKREALKKLLNEG